MDDGKYLLVVIPSRMGNKLMRYLKEGEEKMAGTLIVSVNMKLSLDQLRAIREDIVTQFETGVVVLPEFCTPIFVPEGTTLEVEQTRNIFEENELLQRSSGRFPWEEEKDI